MSDRDPDLQAMFAAAEMPLEQPDFTQQVMARVAADERRKLWRRGLIGLVFGALLWLLSLEALPLFFSQSFVDLADLGLTQSWLAEALSPVNSLGGMLALALLGLRALYRRIFG